LKQILLPLAGVTIFILITGLLVQNKLPFVKPISNQRQLKEISLGKTTIKVEIFDTQEKRHKGLADREMLNPNEGALFVFNEKKVQPAFWMKNMKFAIDIIWIADDKVSQIDKNIPAPEEGTREEDLKFYLPKEPIDYVLEVNTGFSEKNKIEIGTSVDLSIY
jgi:uncharacterized membrane protein (UPF0127 family)